MGCPFKKDEECNKKAIHCIGAIFLTILGVSVALKIITLILCIFPGSSHGNTWLVVIATVMVLVAAKFYKNKSCDSNCECPCHDKDKKPEEKAPAKKTSSTDKN